MSYYRDQLESWLKGVHVNTPRVLDLGGASNPVKNRVAEFKATEVTYMDNGIEEAKESFLQFDINKPLAEQQNGYPIEFFKFGAIFCLEVFEYVYAPAQAIKNIWDMMNNDSVAYISFPSIYPVHEPYKYDYLRYTKAVIEKYLSLYPFKDISITPRKATMGKADLSRFYASERMHPLRHSELPYDIGYLVKARRLEY